MPPGGDARVRPHPALPLRSRLRRPAGGHHPGGAGAAVQDGAAGRDWGLCASVDAELRQSEAGAAQEPVLAGERVSGRAAHAAGGRGGCGCARGAAARRGCSRAVHRCARAAGGGGRGAGRHRRGRRRRRAGRGGGGGGRSRGAAAAAGRRGGDRRRRRRRPAAALVRAGPGPGGEGEAALPARRAEPAHFGGVRLPQRQRQPGRRRPGAQASRPGAPLPGEIAVQDVRQRPGPVGHHRAAVRRGQVAHRHRSRRARAQVRPRALHLRRIGGPVAPAVQDVDTAA